MPTVLILLADGFEELEFVAPYDILKRGGVAVTTAATGRSTSVVSSRGLSVVADALLSEVDPAGFDAVLLPGGQPGTRNLSASPDVAKALRDADAKDRLLCAICAAPSILAAQGFLRGIRATSFPSVKDDVIKGGANHTGAEVEHDGRFITSRGAGTAAAFGFAILSVLVNEEVALRVRSQMQF